MYGAGRSRITHPFATLTFSPEPDIVEKRIEKFGRWACRESPLTAHAAHRQLSESSLIQYTDKNHYVRITICSPVAHQSTAW